MDGIVRSAFQARLETLSAVEAQFGIRFLPIRHHSLACSHHLRLLLDDYQPECVLLEAPWDLQHLQELLTSGKTQAPVSLYSYFTDHRGKLGSEADTYASFYPLLDYSPELVAMREGKQRGIPVHWIDLSHPEQVMLRSPAADKPKNGQHTSVYDRDNVKDDERFFEKVIERAGRTSFHDWWEHTFEMEGMQLSTAQFRERMLSFCYHIREVSGETERIDSAREAFMISEIRRLGSTASRMLVLTGGYHTWGIVDGLIRQEEKLYRPEIEGINAECYAMPFSLEDADPKKGYASGMPYPAYYQLVWDKLASNVQQPFEEAGIDLLLQLAKQLRRHDEAAATPDVIAALELCHGLKQLRKKQQFGANELQDGVLAAFVKGERTLSSDMPIRVLHRMLQGSLRGQLDPAAGVPPLVRDFYEQCKELRLKTATTAEHQLALQLYTKPRDLRKSRFLHQLSFLSIDYGIFQRGLDTSTRTGLNLMQEHWRTKMTPSVEARLIERASYGATVQEAAEASWTIRMREASTLQDLTLLAVDGCRMGLEHALEAMLPRLEPCIRNESSFSQISEAIRRIGFLIDMSDLWQLKCKEDLNTLYEQLIDKGIWLLTSVSGCTAEEENGIINDMKDLCARIQECTRLQSFLQTALASLLGNKQANPAIEGAAAGLYYGAGCLEAEQIAMDAEGFFYGSRIYQAARYLKGLFMTARDLLLIEPRFLTGIGNVITNMSSEHFHLVLPDLKMAFSFFTPYEIDRIAKQVAEEQGADLDMLILPVSVSDETIRLAGRLDDEIKRKMTEWGLLL